MSQKSGNNVSLIWIAKFTNDMFKILMIWFKSYPCLQLNVDVKNQWWPGKIDNFIYFDYHCSFILTSLTNFIESVPNIRCLDIEMSETVVLRHMSQNKLSNLTIPILKCKTIWNQLLPQVNVIKTNKFYLWFF
jgi:hypothetical protein